MPIPTPPHAARYDITVRRRSGRMRAAPVRFRPCLQSGFSIIEVLVVVAILSLTAAVVTPNLLSWRTNMNLRSAAGVMHRHLELAKTLAAKDNRQTLMVFDPEGETYRIVFVDDSGNDITLRAERLPPGIRIVNTHTGYKNRIWFNSRGNADNSTIELAGVKEKKKYITISTLGRIKVK